MTRYGSKYYICLLDPEYNKQNTRAEKEAEDLSAIPQVGDSTERNGYKSGGESTEQESGSNVVYLLCAVYGRDSRVRVLVGECKEADSCIYSTAKCRSVQCQPAGDGPSSFRLRQRLMQNAHLQPAKPFVNAPPIIGPKTAPRPQVRPVPPRQIGRSYMVVITASKAIALTYIPDPPRPQMARLIIRTAIDGAVLQVAEPTSKRVIQRTQVHFVLNCL